MHDLNQLHPSASMVNMPGAFDFGRHAQLAVVGSHRCCDAGSRGCCNPLRRMKCQSMNRRAGVVPRGVHHHSGLWLGLSGYTRQLADQLKRTLPVTGYS
jgi:hypothetical protein